MGILQTLPDQIIVLVGIQLNCHCLSSLSISGRDLYCRLQAYFLSYNIQGQDSYLLHLAATDNDYAYAYLKLLRGADANTFLSWKTPLMKAIQYGSLDVLELLPSHRNIDIQWKQLPTTSASLSTEFEYILRHHISLVAPIVSLLDWYLRLWNCYVVDSALKIQLEEEQGQLQRSIVWLTAECDVLLQCCNDQALDLFGSRQAAAALKDGIVEVLKASEKRAYKMIELN
ncbi:uncharacterized protein N7496_005695 [Penicillium cataractarum]|uniref:Uncharacterized protein n=1 Tax=Penicillium cataractarum TaxID=2100454 RepID=A0A9W9SGN7_9EURO|nr:uncharacterized protein N7496_005695 [Penicillium cataractarum]KAJ5378286.1 hypothetical protein N7496_005695 [Penicillium cataractarum]